MTNSLTKFPNYFTNFVDPSTNRISDPWYRALSAFHNEVGSGFTLQTNTGLSANETSVSPGSTLILSNTGVLSLLSAQPPAGLHITNSSNTGTITQTFTLADDLLALESLNGTGFGVRTGTSAWVNRNIQGTTNRISLTNGDGISNNPIIDISSSYIGQSSITILGTITSGTWNGSIISVSNGGTGVNTSTGTGSVVLNISPSITNANLINPTIVGLSLTNLILSGSLGIGTNTTSTIPLNVFKPGVTDLVSIQSNVSSTATQVGSVLTVKTPTMQIVGDSATNENTPAALSLLTLGVGVASQRGAQLYLGSSRSSSAQISTATYTALQPLDQLGGIYFYGDNSTNVRSYGSLIQTIALSTWTSTSAESALTIQTVSSGTLAASERIRVSSTGLSVTGLITATSTISTPGSILITGSGGLGYATGSGGSVTQSTSKSTGVTLNKASGQITMNGAALLPATSVSFTLTNSVISISDVVIPNIKSGNTVGAYQLQVDGVNTGSCIISLRNNSAISMSESIVISFAVIKSSVI
jgi:hypothetical protein